MSNLMTDTTDIKALREVLRHENKESYYHVGVTVTTLRLLLSKADQLEAERQRADKANRTCSDLLRTATDEAMRANKAEAELAALKGEQVPVAWLNDAHLARGHIEGEAGEEDAGPGMFPVYRERFSAPQKPVVLPKSHYICGCADRYMSEKEVKAAIEAAGGIVKNGE